MIDSGARPQYHDSSRIQLWIRKSFGERAVGTSERWFARKRPEVVTVTWRAEYERKLRTPEEAIAQVQSGQRVVMCAGREPEGLSKALAARLHELHDVELIIGSPAIDYGWFHSPAEEHCQVKSWFLVPRGAAQRWHHMGFGDFMIPEPNGSGNPALIPADVLMIEVSPPNEHGICSLGPTIWDRREHIKSAKLVLAEVNERLIRPRGDTEVSISEIDYFAPYERKGGWGYRVAAEISPKAKSIGELVGTLVHDGDCLQIGGGSIVETLVRMGILDNRVDLGIHSEVTPRGVLRLAQAGVINGRRKNCNPGKVIATSVGGTREELLFAHDNPAVEARDVSYVSNPVNIAANDRVLAINQALAIDLTGQITAESIGPKMWSGSGGQPAFAMGARYSSGGRSVTILPSTVADDKMSSIVPLHPEGTVITVPRTLSDLIVTEHGIASLRGKTQRERAEALIAIAHPDFRAVLLQAARRHFV